MAGLKNVDYAGAEEISYSVRFSNSAGTDIVELLSVCHVHYDGQRVLLSLSDGSQPLVFEIVEDAFWQLQAKWAHARGIHGFERPTPEGK